MTVLKRTPLPHVVDMLADSLLARDWECASNFGRNAALIALDLQGTWLGRDVLTRRFELQLNMIDQPAVYPPVLKY